MLELLIALVAFVVIVINFDFDFLTPKINRLVQRFGWQDEPRTPKINSADSMEAIVDSIGIVKTLFTRSVDGMPFEGRVALGGTEWKAEQISGDLPLTIGSNVLVIRTEGTILYVEASETKNV